MRLTTASSPNCCATTGVVEEVLPGLLSTHICSTSHLAVPFRSHPAILKIPNELFYDGELQACADEILRNSYCGWEHLPKKVKKHLTD